MKKIIDIFALIIIIVGQTINIVLECIGLEQKWDRILSSSVIIVFAAFCISMYYEMNSYKKNLSKKLEEILFGSNIANTKPGKGSDSFYGYSLGYMNSSNSSLWLTSVNDSNPNIMGSKQRNKYFATVIPYAKENKNVEVKRIIKIPTLDKLEWVKEQLNEAENLDNVSFAYIEDDVKLLNLQIYDEKRMMLWDPSQNKVSAQHNKFINCENSDIVEMFSQYYENIWKELKKNNKGFIIKDGNKTTKDDIDEKLNFIENKIKSESNI